MVSLFIQQGWYSKLIFNINFRYFHKIIKLNNAIRTPKKVFNALTESTMGGISLQKCTSNCMNITVLKKQIKDARVPRISFIIVWIIACPMFCQDRLFTYFTYICCFVCVCIILLLFLDVNTIFPLDKYFNVTTHVKGNILFPTRCNDFKDM